MMNFSNLTGLTFILITYVIPFCMCGYSFGFSLIFIQQLLSGAQTNIRSMLSYSLVAFSLISYMTMNIINTFQLIYWKVFGVSVQKSWNLWLLNNCKKYRTNTWYAKIDEYFQIEEKSLRITAIMRAILLVVITVFAATACIVRVFIPINKFDVSLHLILIQSGMLKVSFESLWGWSLCITLNRF